MRRMEKDEDHAYYSADVVQLYSELMVELIKSPAPEHRQLGQEFGQFVSYDYNITFSIDGQTVKPIHGGGGVRAIEHEQAERPKP